MLKLIKIQKQKVDFVMPALFRNTEASSTISNAIYNVYVQHYRVNILKWGVTKHSWWPASGCSSWRPICLAQHIKGFEHRTAIIVDQVSPHYICIYTYYPAGQTHISGMFTFRKGRTLTCPDKRALGIPTA